MHAGDGRTPDSGNDEPAPGGDDRDPGGDHVGDRVDFRRSTFMGPVVGKVVVQHVTPPDRTGPCTLPMVQAGFTGRATELAALEARLRAPADPAPDAPVVCVVTGLGGMGKTALALKAAHRARTAGWFAGGALFLDLAGYDDNPVTPTQAVTSLLHALAAGDFDTGADRVGHFGEEGHPRARRSERRGRGVEQPRSRAAQVRPSRRVPRHPSPGLRALP
ncbi:AAA family ATPase [Streptomyces sp. NPDC054804]